MDNYCSFQRKRLQIYRVLFETIGRSLQTEVGKSSRLVSGPAGWNDDRHWEDLFR